MAFSRFSANRATSPTRSSQITRFTGRHHIGVPGKRDQGCGIAAACPPVIDIVDAQMLCPDADGLQTLGQQLLAALIVRRDRGSFYQSPREIKRGAHVRTSDRKISA